jgi:hypothetical protein
MTQPAERITIDPTRNKKIIRKISKKSALGNFFIAREMPNKQGKNYSQIPVG